MGCSNTRVFLFFSKRLIAKEKIDINCYFFLEQGEDDKTMTKKHNQDLFGKKTSNVLTLSQNDTRY